jgi:hypothetical protein
MKITLASLLLISLSSFAQKAAVTDIPAEGNTVITVEKGVKKEGSDKAWEIVEGNSEISGDPELMQKEARASWKTACSDWKKEIKELNKSNEVLVLNCNKPSCAKADANQTVCESTGIYKVKVKK